MSRFTSGEIVLVDWRSDALPKEANKLRPCIIIEDDELFDELHPTVIVVPLTTDESMVVAALATRIEPDDLNGATSVSYAVSHAVVTAAKSRVRNGPGTRISAAQLASIRRQVAESIGLIQ